MNLKSLSSRINPKYLLLGAFILYGVSLVAVLPIQNIWFMLIPVLIYGAANGVNMPNVHAQVSGMAPAENRGAIMSINGMVLRLGQTLGPGISATLFALTGIMGVLIGGIIFTLISALVIALVVSPVEQKG
jgi:MFS family permease